MKIAYVISALNAGGAERVTIELANVFAKAGQDVTVFVGWPSTSEPAVKDRLDPHVRVEYIETRERNRPTSYLAAMLWTWRQRERLSTFDVLHCHLTYGAYIGALFDVWRNARQRSRPLIVETYHAVGMRIPALNRWAHSRMAARRDVLVLMAVDPYWERFTAEHPRLTVKTILNGAPRPAVGEVDAAARRRYRQELGIPDTARLVVGSIGMLRPDRQPRIFIPIIAKLVREFGNDVQWIFAGEGAERPALERAVAAAGLSKNVRFAGLVSDVRYPLSVMTLHFTLTVGAVCGLAAMEGALAGVPVVGVQLLPGYAGNDDWIWSSANADAVADAAVRLLRNDGERSALAERQQRYAQERHSVDAMARSYMETYVSALQPAARNADDAAAARIEP